MATWEEEPTVVSAEEPAAASAEAANAAFQLALLKEAGCQLALLREKELIQEAACQKVNPGASAGKPGKTWAVDRV
jgi:hypothetical protein